MSELLGDLLELLPSVRDHHAPSDPLHLFLKKIARREAEKVFGPGNAEAHPLGSIGSIIFPHHVMGSVTSTNLFDLDELIMFSFYWRNRDRYKRAVDIGANIGLHSIVLDHCGLEVHCYEPDPAHVAVLEGNLERNQCSRVTVHNAAVSNRSGKAEFIRLVDNTTGSHLAGAKANPYGEMNRMIVSLEDIRDVVRDADLVKIDAEGHEKEILLALSEKDWATLDAMVEVGSEENAKAVFEHFSRMNVHLFAQMKNWERIMDAAQMPTSYRDGTLFISARDIMPW